MIAESTISKMILLQISRRGVHTGDNLVSIDILKRHND